MRPFERFVTWQRSLALVKQVYRSTQGWPPGERDGLTAQVRRAAVSVVANIAEGSAKRGRREFRRYLDVALGSLEEVSCLLIVARELEILNHPDWEELERTRDEAGRTLWGLYRSLSDPEVG
jgi:four helix bundle protein